MTFITKNFFWQVVTLILNILQMNSLARLEVGAEFPRVMLAAGLADFLGDIHTLRLQEGGGWANSDKQFFFCLILCKKCDLRIRIYYKHLWNSIWDI